MDPPVPGSWHRTAYCPSGPRERPARLEANGVCAWFGGRLVLDQVSLVMERSMVTALIGPSGCGKSTFLRILNRMHEVTPGAELAGTVDLDGVEIYGPTSGPRRRDSRSGWSSRSRTRSRRCRSTTTCCRACGSRGSGCAMPIASSRRC